MPLSAYYQWRVGAFWGWIRRIAKGEERRWVGRGRNWRDEGNPRRRRREEDILKGRKEDRDDYVDLGVRLVAAM